MHGELLFERCLAGRKCSYARRVGSECVVYCSSQLFVGAQQKLLDVHVKQIAEAEWGRGLVRAIGGCDVLTGGRRGQSRQSNQRIGIVCVCARGVRTWEARRRSARGRRMGMAPAGLFPRTAALAKVAY